MDQTIQKLKKKIEVFDSCIANTLASLNEVKESISDLKKELNGLAGMVKNLRKSSNEVIHAVQNANIEPKLET